MKILSFLKRQTEKAAGVVSLLYLYLCLFYLCMIQWILKKLIVAVRSF